MTTLALAADARTGVLAIARPAVLQAMVTYADAGVGQSRIQIYGTTRPATAGDDPGGAPLATIVLSDPCGTVTDEVLTLVQASEIGDLIATNGDAVWGRWETGTGDPIADGDVTDDAGDGPFKLGGTDGVTLNAGGRVLLGIVEMT